jgi:hypothetical protein
VRKGFVLRKSLDFRAQLFVVRRLRLRGWFGDEKSGVEFEEIFRPLAHPPTIRKRLKASLQTARHLRNAWIATETLFAQSLA